MTADTTTCDWSNTKENNAHDVPLSQGPAAALSSLALLVALATLPALAAAPSLKPFNADYVANYMGMEGTGAHVARAGRCGRGSTSLQHPEQPGQR